MTTRLFVTIMGMCLIMMLAVILGLGPMIVHASAETVHLCQGIALVLLALGTPLVFFCVFMTWVWEVVQRMIARRRLGGS